jgi:hypothetical protein
MLAVTTAHATMPEDRVAYHVSFDRGTDHDASPLSFPASMT